MGGNSEEPALEWDESEVSAQIVCSQQHFPIAGAEAAELRRSTKARARLTEKFRALIPTTDKT